MALSVKKLIAVLAFTMFCGSVLPAQESSSLGELWILPEALKHAKKIQYTAKVEGKEKVLHVLKDGNIKKKSSNEVRQQVQKIIVHFPNKGGTTFVVKNGIVLFDVTEKELTFLITAELSKLEQSIVEGAGIIKRGSTWDKFTEETNSKSQPVK